MVRPGQGPGAHMCLGVSCELKCKGHLVSKRKKEGKNFLLFFLQEIASEYRDAMCLQSALKNTSLHCNSGTNMTEKGVFKTFTEFIFFKESNAAKTI